MSHINLGNEEFLPVEEVARLRQRRWLSQREYVLEHSTFFQKLWNGCRVPEKLEELPELPLCDKPMLRESQAKYPPFGDYCAAEEKRIVRLHRTSGTTGKPMNAVLTQADTLQTARVGARSLRASGVRPEHRIVHCLNFQMWMGGLTDHLSVEATGATAIPFGVGNTRHLIQTILDLKVDATHSTPSYPAVLEQTMADYFPDLKPRDLGLKLGLFGGEAGLDNMSFREKLEDTWGYAVRNANYGMGDIFSNFAGQCELNNDLHFVGHDVLHAELINPESLDVVPFREGETGELVITHLAREAQPLVRFRTNDMIAVTATDTCVCGRTTPRFRVLGRSDDMIIIRGINVYPAAVGGVIAGFPALSGEFRIRLRGSGPYDRLPVEVEQSESTDLPDNLAESVESAIKHTTRVTARVQILPPRSLPRTEGKTQRIIKESA